MEKTLYLNLGAYQTNTIASLKGCRQIGRHNIREKRTGLFKPPIRVRFGKKIWNKSSAVNAYMFVEFEDILSIANVTGLNARGKILHGFKSNIAGSNTFVQIRRSQRK